MADYTDEQIAEIKKNAKLDGVKEFFKASKIEESKFKKLIELGQKYDFESVIKENSKLKLGNDVSKAASKHGFNDHDYATFLYSQHIEGLDDEKLKDVNPDKFIESIKSNDSFKSHFGDSTTNSMGNNKRPTEKTGNNGGKTDMSDSSAEDLNRYFSELGIG